MMKNDEIILWKAILNKPEKTYVRDVIDNLHEQGLIAHKRAWYIPEKGAVKDWYDYGVTVDLGWLTEDGIGAIKALT